MALFLKKDVISDLVKSLTEYQIILISQLVAKKGLLTSKELTSLFTKSFKKKISVQAAKSKGRDLQKWVATQIGNLLDIPHGKDEEITSREMGQSGTDIRLSPRVKGLFPYSIECKNTEVFSKAIAQARQNQSTDTKWLLFVKSNQHKPIAVLDAEYLFHLFKMIKTAEAKKSRFNRPVND